MRFVRTPEEIKQVQGVYARPQFLNVRSLTVVFETTPAAIEALLPPPLEPAPEPLGIAWVADVGNSNCVGPFMGAALYVRARYKGITGNYCLAMPMSTVEAVTFGRELYGEPKKLAKIILEQEGEHIWGSAERHNIRFLSLRGRLDESAPAGRNETSSFHFKYLPRADGSGFDCPPLLVRVITESTVTSAQRGKGELVLRDSPHDPLADIPVTQVVEATYSEGHNYTRGEVLCEVDPKAFLPYAFAKTDAMDVMVDGTIMQAQAVRKTRGKGKGKWRTPA